jgi:hypothetical protein
MVSGGAPAIESDLATGTPAPARARRRWPILDVHNVKQPSKQSFIVRRNGAFRRRTSDVRNLHARHFRRCASPRSARIQAKWPLIGRPECTPTQTRSHARPDADGTRRALAKTLDFVSFCGPSGPSCLFGGGSGPPPVSPVLCNPVRVDWMGNRASTTQARVRSAGDPVVRQRR